MPKNQNDMPADMWLHVAADALLRYVNGGGTAVAVFDDDGLHIAVPGVFPDDPRLPAAFATIVPAPLMEGQQAEPV